MTNNSYICNFIKENPYDWKEKLEQYPYYLKIKEDDGLAIFNYNMLAFEILEEATEEKEAVIAKVDFTNPIVQEARGIIINPIEKEVVCWPFRKFGNYGESYVDDIDWTSAHVQSKIDGSIMKVWFDKRSDKNIWRVSTNSVIEAHNAQNGMYVNFGEIFDEAAKDVLDYSCLDKDYTYIFELVSPKTRVVIDYPETKIYHTGTRSNITGQEYRVDIGVEKPKEYALSSLSDCIKAANMLNAAKEESDRFNVEYEGFVVCDKNFNRIKIKSPEYLMAHNALNNGVLSYKRTFELIENNETEEYLTYFPQHRETLKEYERKYFKVISNIKKYTDYAKMLFKQVNKDKKEFSKIVKDDFYKSFAFDSIKYDLTAQDLFNRLHLANKKTLLENADNFLKDNPSFKECASIGLEL